MSQGRVEDTTPGGCTKNLIKFCRLIFELLSCFSQLYVGKFFCLSMVLSDTRPFSLIDQFFHHGWRKFWKIHSETSKLTTFCHNFLKKDHNLSSFYGFKGWRLNFYFHFLSDDWHMFQNFQVILPTTLIFWQVCRLKIWSGGCHTPPHTPRRHAPV